MLCSQGCGRPTAPGTLANGSSWKTCCRDCAVSGGKSHHPQCKSSPPSNVFPSPSLCGKGCGRNVAPGTQKNGRPWKTCCKGCGLGQNHSSSCHPASSPHASPAPSSNPNPSSSSSSSNASQNPPTTIDDLLDLPTLQLGAYKADFLANGIDDVDVLIHLTENDLSFMKIGHRRKFMVKVKEIYS